MAILFVVIASLSFSVFLYSQEEPNADTPVGNPDIERSLERALDFAENGNWDEALAILARMKELYPENSEIERYQKSIERLKTVDRERAALQKESAEAKRGDAPKENNSQKSDAEEPPKFVIERSDEKDRVSPSSSRDILRLGISFQVLATNPISNNAVIAWATLEEFLYSSPHLDLRYWLPFFGRSLGFSLGFNGYAWVPGNPSRLFNTVDLGLNVRGFVFEQISSRMEVGLDFGLALNSEKNVTTGKLSRNLSLFVGLWISSPILYQIFRINFLEQLVFAGGLRIYSSLSNTLLETVNYHVDGSWRFDWGYLGIRLGWWDFQESGSRQNILGLSFMGGYRY